MFRFLPKRQLTFFSYLNTPFLVPGIKSNVKKKVSGLVPLLYMYLIDTKFETIFFQSWLNPWDYKRGIKVFNNFSLKQFREFWRKILNLVFNRSFDLF